MQQKYWMAWNLNRLSIYLHRAANLLENLTTPSQRNEAHQLISTVKFEMGVASEFTGLGSGGEYRPYSSMSEALELIEDQLHEPIEPAEARREATRLRQISLEITGRLVPDEQSRGSTRELGPEFDRKTLAQAYAEGEAIGEKLLNPDIGSGLRFE